MATIDLVAARSGIDTSNGRRFDPKPYIRAGYAVIFLAFGVFGVWASTAPLASGVIAPGVVSVEGNRKVIQHLEGGIVSEILVKEGGVVNVGDILLKLDPTQAQGTFAVWDGKREYLEASEARLTAESLDSSTIDYPKDLLESSDPEAIAAMKIQTSLFNDRRSNRDSKIGILRARIDQLNEASKGLTSQLSAIDKQLTSINSETDRLQEGARIGVVATNQLAQMSRNLLEFQGRKGEIEAQIAKTRENVSETELQILQTQREFAERAVNEHKDVQDQLSEVREKVRVTKDILRRTIVRAPVAGMVQNIQVHTINGVIRPAEPLMEIVPLHDNLVITAHIRPLDIDDVSVGAKVQIMLPGFSTKTTPVIFGKVSVISKDVIQPTASGQQPYYQALIEVRDEDLPENIKGRILPGMPAEAIVSTGERTMMRYLIKPLIETFSKGMREK